MSQNTKFLDPEQVLFRSGLHTGATVVDLGAGSGYFALAAAKIVGESGKVVVVDILEQALEHVTAQARVGNHNNIETIRHDLEAGSTSIADGCADLVVVANLLHQIQKTDNLFAEIYRMLKTGGRLLIIDWNQKPGPLGPKSVSRIDAEKARALAEKSKLNFGSEIETDQFHYGLIFSK